MWVLKISNPFHSNPLKIESLTQFDSRNVQWMCYDYPFIKKMQENPHKHIISLSKQEPKSWKQRLERGEEPEETGRRKGRKRKTLEK